MARKNLPKNVALSEDALIAKLSGIIHGEQSYYLPRFTYPQRQRIVVLLGVMREQGLVKMPHEREKVAHLVSEALLRFPRRWIAYARRAARHGDVSSTLEKLESFFLTFEASPALLGTSLQELSDLRRRGLSVGARRTIAAV